MIYACSCVQEIDGMSLLLMKRADVMREMSLKAGPAIKIYTLIQLLQIKGQMLGKVKL